jgi:hypothetical protein
MNNRRFITAVGVAGGMLVTGLAQLGAAPTASADVQAIINSIDGTFTVGQDDLTAASAAFSADNIPVGLSESFGALNTDSLDPLADLLYGGYETAEGVPGPYPDFGWPGGLDFTPATLTAAIADVNLELGYAQQDFGAAATAFAGDNLTTGALDLFGGIGALEQVPELSIIGLADSLSGGM